LLAVRALNCDDIIEEDDDVEDWADPVGPYGGRSGSGDGNDNYNGEGEEEQQGGEPGTGKGKGKGKGNGKGTGIVKQTPGGDDIARAVALQLQRDMYEADSDTEGELERLYLMPEASPAVSISPNDDTDSTEKLEGKYESELDPDVDMRVEDDVDAPDGIDLDSDVDMEGDGDNDEEYDEEEKDEEKEDEEEVEEEDEDEEEDKDEDDGKEPRTIGQGKMINTSADEADTMVDDEPAVLPEQGQDMSQHIPTPQPPAPAPPPQTLETPPRRRTPETHTLSGPEFLGLVMPQKPCPAAPPLGEAEAARNTSDVDVEQ